MEKLIIMLMLSLLSATSLQAQTFAEWFSQKKTQKKYLIEQIAALKIYAEYLKKGYDISKKGLGTISQIKNGEFNLHRDFFGALSTVNPVIKKDTRIVAVEQMQTEILDIKNRTIKNLAGTDLLSEKEKQYITDVFGRLLENCNNLFDGLEDVALSNNLTMKDDERLKRIGQVYTDMEDNYRFANYFNNQITALVTSRQKEKREAERSRLIFGIK